MKLYRKSRNSMFLFGMPATAFVTTVVLVLGCVDSINAKDIAVFDNGSYVDTGGGTSDESDTIQASLVSLGHEVTTFTGTSASAWTTAAASSELILVPELRGDLNSALTSQSRSAIANYVSSGGGLVLIGTELDHDLGFLNDVFGYSVGRGGSVSTFNLNTLNAAGTPFADDPASLSYNNHTESVAIPSLPPGALTIYENDGDSIVWVADVGRGSIGYLGWDWYNAVPMGTLDGGWNSVLDSTVQHVPEPATVLLLGLGGLVLRRRKLGKCEK